MKMFFTRAAVASAMAAALALSGCAGFIDVSFPATADNITKMDCAKVSETVQAFKTAHDAPNGSPLHDELATKWKISSEEAYIAALTEFDTKRDACNAESMKKAPAAPVSTVSASPSTTPSSTATPASASATATPIYCWGTLQKRLGESDWTRLLGNIDDAKDQLGFDSEKVKEWSKLDVDCRVIVAFDGKKTGTTEEEKAIRDLATKQVGVELSASDPIVHAETSVQVAQGPRVTMPSNDQVRVILPKIVNGKSAPTSGVELTQGLSLGLLAGITFVK